MSLPCGYFFHKISALGRNELCLLLFVYRWRSKYGCCTDHSQSPRSTASFVGVVGHLDHGKGGWVGMYELLRGKWKLARQRPMGRTGTVAEAGRSRPAAVAGWHGGTHPASGAPDVP